MTDARPVASIEFFADLTCPWCFVAWEALKKAALSAQSEAACNVAWRGFILHPQLPQGGVDRQEFYAANGFDAEKLAATREVLIKAAADAGASFDPNRPARLPSTLDAHRLIHWAALEGVGEGAIDALFKAYWTEGKDIGDQAVLAELAQGVGFDPVQTRELLASWTDIDVVQAEHRAAAEAGVRGVPVTIFNRKAVLMGAESSDAYLKAIREFAEPAAPAPAF